MNDLGFAKSSEAKNLLHATTGYDYNELIVGGFKRGERRRKLRGFYIKLRMYDFKNLISEEDSKQEAANRYHKLNQTCIPPLESEEVRINIASAEKYFTEVVLPDMGKNVKLTKSEMNDIENANLADEMIEKFKFIATVPGELYFYKHSKGIYVKNGDDLLGTELDKQQRSTSDIETIIKIIHHRTKIRPDEVVEEDGDESIFDRDWAKINTKNKVIDLKTGEVLEFSPEHRNTISLPVNYNPDAKCEKFNEFLKSSLDNDERKIIWIKEMMASCLIKRNIFQRGYVLHGRGANGKGTLLRTLTNLLGKNNTTSSYLSTLEDDRFIGYDLYGKTASIAGDGGTEKIEKTGKIKSILGGDILRCEEKYKNSFPFYPFATMIFTFNELPEILDSSDGLNRKLQLVHWKRSFYGKDANDSLDLMEKDPEELSGILNELIPICQKIIKTRKLTNPYSVDETKKEWTMLENSFYNFSTSQLDLVSSEQISVNEIFEKFLNWCKDNGFIGLERRIFVKKMDDFLKSDGERSKTRAITRVNGNSVEVFLGVCVKKDSRLTS